MNFCLLLNRKLQICFYLVHPDTSHPSILADSPIWDAFKSNYDRVPTETPPKYAIGHDIYS